MIAWLVLGVFFCVVIALIVRMTVKPPNLHPRRTGRRRSGAGFTGQAWTAGEDNDTGTGGGASCGGGAGF
ncbi:hypothetical protein ACIQU1_11145 [Streptomyces angustmyceticus]|uniref:hypothetical protein n=1 Tax=Streptomyces angustmyceticus TaxID=285578 RepID=UPI0034510AFB